MNKKLIFSLVGLVVLIGGSYVLYQNLTANEEEPSALVDEAQQNDETILNNIADEAFDFTFENEKGEKVMLSSYKGKPIVLNFWASWCPPCREEMPIFQEFQKNNPDVTFLFMNQADGRRETKQKAHEFLKNEGLDMPIQFDETQASTIKFALNGLPTTYFIDAEGNIHNRAIGGINAETLKMAIEGISK